MTVAESRDSVAFMGKRRVKVAASRVRPRLPQLDQGLSYREAARALGHEKADPSGRKLRAIVQARERQTGTPIAIRLNGALRPKSRVTLGALYTHFPELRTARDDRLARSFKPLLEGTQQRIRQMVAEEIRDRIEPRLIAIEQALQHLRRRGQK